MVVLLQAKAGDSVRDDALAGERVIIRALKEKDYKIKLQKTEWNPGMLWRVVIRILKDDKIKPIFLIIDALGMFGQLYYFPKKDSIINGSNDI